MLGKSRKNSVQVVNKSKREVEKTLPSFVENKSIDKKSRKIDETLLLGKTKIRKKISMKGVVIAICLLLIVATIAFIFKFVNFNVTEMLWKVSLTKGSDEVNNKSIRYEGFKNGIVRISNDGITFVNEIGEVKWTVSYNMKDPIYETRERYFVIADKNGFEFYIFDENGITGKNTSTFPIQKITLSSEGIVYLLEYDENSSYISVYRNNGVPVDISIKTNLTGDGMPIDISTSSDGTELLTSNVCLSSKDIFFKAVYYNFDEVGKSTNAKRIVGEFIEDLNDKFLAKVYFFDNERSCLIYNGGIYFVSTSMLTHPIITSKVNFDEIIKSISYNDKYIAVVLANNQLLVYNKSGDILADKKIDYEYDNFYLSDDYVVFLCGNRIMIYDERGRMFFDKEMNQNIEYVAKRKSLFFTELLIGLIDGIECIRIF